MIEFNVETLFSYFMPDMAQRLQHQRAGKVEDLRSSSFCRTIISARTKRGKRFMEFQIAPWVYYWDVLLPPRVIT